MPRKPRFFLPDVPIHMIIRGNSRQVVFAEADDFFAYKSWLREAAEQLQCRIHAYVFMSNHIHLLLSASETGNLSKLPQAVSRRYVPFFNRKYGKSGTLWEGRFKASSVDTDRYLMSCYRYIELNPVRAMMVSDPRFYEWSSYHANALGEKDPLITSHPVYQALGATREERKQAYKSLFDNEIDDKLLEQIRDCTQTGVPLGSAKFTEQIEELLSVKVGRNKRGRPKKGTDPL